MGMSLERLDKVMEKKLYIAPITEQFECRTVTALCSSNEVTGDPGSHGSEPGGMNAPGRRVF